MEEKLKKLNGKIKRRLVKLADLQKQYNQKSSKTSKKSSAFFNPILRIF